MTDYSGCLLSKKYYGGSEFKLGIYYKGVSLMLKFQKDTPFGLRFNHVSEYLGCHIYESVGLLCQETFLGIYKGRNVVACKDFIPDGFQFVPFNDVGESTLEEDKEEYQYSYEDIVELLKINKRLTNVDETISTFFDMFIIDSLIANFDRHGGNWGFLKKDNKYQLSPIFDNGSCLFPQLIDENMMKLIMNNEEETNKRVYGFPTSQIKLNNRKSSYFDVISSLEFEECNKALAKNFPLINLEKINLLIDSVEGLTFIHKEFYKYILKERYTKILKFSYDKLIEREGKMNG